MDNVKYMKLALQLAERGRGYVNPNPMVGAVIVNGGKIVGGGFHSVFGGPHAEISALSRAGKKAHGAAMYVSLEPCCHFGKTPPCTKAIIKAGIKKVVIATLDPNPLNNGKGVKELKKNGIEIEKGIMEKEASLLNEKFFTYHIKKRPFISLKCAATLDGKIATANGNARWISSKRSRDYGHLLRHEHDAVMAGINTIKTDDPVLSARFRKKMRKPCIVIVDTKLSIPIETKVVKNARENRLIIATTKNSSFKKKKELQARGVEILVVPARKSRVNLPELARKLAEMGITSILAEGGGELNYSLLHERLVDKIYFFYSPKILGGRAAPTPVEGKGIENLNKAIKIRDVVYSKIDKDLLITGYPVYKN